MTESDGPARSIANGAHHRDPGHDSGQVPVWSRRRALLGATVGVTAVAGGGALLGGTAVASTVPASGRASAPARGALRAPVLEPGDRVRVVSPASTPSREGVARGVEILRSWGLVVELGEHVFDQYGYLAGKDEDRLADLDAAFADPGIRGVFAADGGYGTGRIVDEIDLRRLRRDPKVVVGFSDITSLQARLWREARLATIHGPMVNWSDSRTGPESIEALRRAVMTTDDVVLTRDPNEVTAPVLVRGKAEGPVLGGNLTLVDTAIATGEAPDMGGAIFFFEDVGEAPYRIDRMLTHLRRSGVLDGVAGVVVGQITGSVPGPGQWDAVGVLNDRLGDLGVPVFGGLRLGHGTGQLTIPLGSKATMDAVAGTLTVTSAVTAARTAIRS